MQPAHCLAPRTNLGKEEAKVLCLGSQVSLNLSTSNHTTP